MNSTKRIAISLTILMILVIAFFFITTQLTGFSVFESQNGFEKCLAEKQLYLYINSPDTDEALKDIQISDYLQFFKIQNCYMNNVPCNAYNIDSYPTFIIEGNRIIGDISINQLSKYSGCKS